MDQFKGAMCHYYSLLLIILSFFVIFPKFKPKIIIVCPHFLISWFCFELAQMCGIFEINFNPNLDKLDFMIPGQTAAAFEEA